MKCPPATTEPAVGPSSAIAGMATKTAAARAGALSASLQQARADLVTAREEERRRLRRDLHDSLGPGLGAVTLRIETARGLAARDPERADAVLEQAVGDISALLADVRRLVHDLRPPALDELGLLGALRTQARRLSGDDLEIQRRRRSRGAVRGGRGRRLPHRLRGR